MIKWLYTQHWYKKAKQRARYEGQLQGDEHRFGPSSLQERLEDNDLIEGKYENTLRSLIKQKRWNDVNLFTKKMREEGFSGDRVNSILTRAMYGIRL
jgi:hypothetical protein